VVVVEAAAVEVESSDTAANVNFALDSIDSVNIYSGSTGVKGFTNWMALTDGRNR